VTIRKAPDSLDTVVKTMTDSKEWIEAMVYSPDGSKLAVGSHDNNIYLYDVNGGYSLSGTCKGNSSFIVSVDFSADGEYIRTVSGAHELLFYTTNNCKQDTSGATNTKGT